MKGEEPPLRVVRVTHFAMIDGAMMRVVRAVSKYEAAQYTRAERDALDRVVKAAIELKAVFVKVAKHINEKHEIEQEQEQSQETENKAAVENKEPGKDKDKRRGMVKP